jgi:excisionase family DNA binding protein
MSEKRDFVTLDGLRKLLHISPKTAQLIAESGEIPGRRIGKTWKFYREDIVEYIRSGNRPKDSTV